MEFKELSLMVVKHRLALDTALKAELRQGIQEFLVTLSELLYPTLPEAFDP